MPYGGGCAEITYLMLFAVLMITFNSFKMYFPGWYHKRLVRNMVNEVIAQKRLDAASRNAISRMLETGDHYDLVNWVRQNEDKLSGEMLAITKRVVNTYAGSVVAFLIFVVVSLIFIDFINTSYN